MSHPFIDISSGYQSLVNFSTGSVSPLTHRTRPRSDFLAGHTRYCSHREPVSSRETNIAYWNRCVRLLSQPTRNPRCVDPPRSHLPFVTALGPFHSPWMLALTRGPRRRLAYPLLLTSIVSLLTCPLPGLRCGTGSGRVKQASRTRLVPNDRKMDWCTSLEVPLSGRAFLILYLLPGH